MKKKVQLVLGSGGARGISHIGVIESLLQDGYEIVEVVGCSMGAVVGGMYCSGHLTAYRDWLLKLTKSDVYSLFDLAFSMQGLVKGERIFGVLQQMTGEQSIEKLAVPFTAVATDIISRSEIHFTEGNLYKALRASTGIPGVFTPVADNKYLFVDGGVLNPLPVNVIKRREDTIVVAVNLNGAFMNDVSPTVIPGPVNTEEKQDILSRMRNYFSSPEKNATKIVPSTPTTFSMFELLDASYDASLDRLVDLTLELHPADVVINIPRNICTEFEFYQSARLIDAGKKAYGKAMEKYLRDTANK